jgi:hypothetical protein
MTPTKGYYSIVQYCPDLSRGETTNIGIVLLVPERGYLSARNAGAVAKVHRHPWEFFSTHEAPFCEGPYL